MQVFSGQRTRGSGEETTKNVSGLSRLLADFRWKPLSPGRPSRLTLLALSDASPDHLELTPPDRE